MEGRKAHARRWMMGEEVSVKIMKTKRAGWFS